jgi:hypothetical protein
MILERRGCDKPFIGLTRILVNYTCSDNPEPMYWKDLSISL